MLLFVERSRSISLCGGRSNMRAISSMSNARCSRNCESFGLNPIDCQVISSSRMAILPTLPTAPCSSFHDCFRRSAPPSQRLRSRTARRRRRAVREIARGVLAIREREADRLARDRDRREPDEPVRRKAAVVQHLVPEDDPRGPVERPIFEPDGLPKLRKRGPIGVRRSPENVPERGPDAAGSAPRRARDRRRRSPHRRSRGARGDRPSSA
jgi:hypothetical protein